MGPPFTNTDSPTCLFSEQDFTKFINGHSGDCISRREFAVSWNTYSVSNNTKPNTPFNLGAIVPFRMTGSSPFPKPSAIVSNQVLQAHGSDDCSAPASHDFVVVQSCQSKDMDEKIKSYRQAIFKMDHAERAQRKRGESGDTGSQDQSQSFTASMLLVSLHSPSSMLSMLRLYS